MKTKSLLIATFTAAVLLALSFYARNREQQEISDRSAPMERARSNIPGGGTEQDGFVDARDEDVTLPSVDDQADAASSYPQNPGSQSQNTRQPASVVPSRGEPAAEGPPPGPAAMAIEFGAQKRDPQWSQRTESMILSELAATPGLAAQSVAVECRETLCRVEIVHPRGVRPDRPLFDDSGDSLGVEGTMRALFIGQDGAPITLVYLKRRDPSTTQSEVRAAIGAR